MSKYVIITVSIVVTVKDTHVQMSEIHFFLPLPLLSGQ